MDVIDETNEPTPGDENGAASGPSPQVNMRLEKLQAEAEQPGDSDAPESSDEGQQDIPIERPWKDIVAGSRELIQANTPNWTWPDVGSELFFGGIEKQLTVWMPNGLADLDKYPIAMTGIGAAFVLVANLESYKVKGKKRLRIKPLRKPDPSEKTDGASETSSESNDNDGMTVTVK